MRDIVLLPAFKLKNGDRIELAGHDMIVTSKTSRPEEPGIVLWLVQYFSEASGPLRADSVNLVVPDDFPMQVYISQTIYATARS